MRHIYSTYKEHYKALIFLGLPIVIGQIGVIVLGFADTLMIGHHSTIELGAASFVNNVFNLAIIFSTGFSYGLTPIVGGLYGTRQYAPAGQALRNSLLANLMVALLLTICMTVLYLNIERLGQPEELIPLIKPYYLVLLASLVFVMLFNGFKQFTDGITDTKIRYVDIAWWKCLEYHRKLYPDLWKARIARVRSVGSRYQHAVLAYRDGDYIYHHLYA